MSKEIRASWKPTGALLETLSRFDAPDSTCARIARRAGALAGGRFLPLDSLTTSIETSMQKHGGLPDWEEIEQDIGSRVTDVYRKLKR